MWFMIFIVGCILCLQSLKLIVCLELNTVIDSKTFYVDAYRKSEKVGCEPHNQLDVLNYFRNWGEVGTVESPYAPIPPHTSK